MKKKKKAFAIEARACPVCHWRVDQARNVLGQPRTRPADVAMCGNCGTMLVFDDALQLQIADAAVLAGLSPVMRRAIALLENTLHRHGLRGGRS